MATSLRTGRFWCSRLRPVVALGAVAVLGGCVAYPADYSGYNYGYGYGYAPAPYYGYSSGPYLAFGVGGDRDRHGDWHHHGYDHDWHR